MKETYEVSPGQTVTITVEATRGHVYAAGERLYTAAEVGDLQASEAELVAAPLKAENQRLARQVARREARVADLERQLSRSIEREDKLEADADEERETHRRSLAARDSLLQAVVEILSSPEVIRARDVIATKNGIVLATAVENASKILKSNDQSDSAL